MESFAVRIILFARFGVLTICLCLKLNIDPITNNHSRKQAEYMSYNIDLNFIDQQYLDFWLVVLRLNVPVNNFSVMSGRSHRFLGN